MIRSIPVALAAVFAMFASPALTLSADKAPAFTSSPDYQTQGEYTGTIDVGGKQQKVGVQIVALGQGKFALVKYEGGLPGDGWDPAGKRSRTSGELQGGVAEFVDGDDKLTAADGVINWSKAHLKIGELKRVERTSPTLGAKPPADAVVLFDGTSADKWNGGRMTEDGLLVAGTISKPSFRDFHLHAEFQTPFMPAARGQGRGNSGVYLQNRYELQVLDSFGLDGKDNECGGFYSIKAPAVNMCYPPQTWQTYDIDFTGARFDSAGKKTADAVVTARHNGVLIHDNFALPKLTPGGAPQEAPGEGPLMLQDHGNPVRFRNIWVVEKK